jgi:hypothetical protein
MPLSREIADLLIKEAVRLMTEDVLTETGAKTFEHDMHAKEDTYAPVLYVKGEVIAANAIMHVPEIKQKILEEPLDVSASDENGAEMAIRQFWLLEGRPPTVAEVEAMSDDKNAQQLVMNAFAKLVKRSIELVKQHPNKKLFAELACKPVPPNQPK